MFVVQLFGYAEEIKRLFQYLIELRVLLNGELGRNGAVVVSYNNKIIIIFIC